MDVAGWVLLSIVVLILVYIVPTFIRARQVVVDARVDDRFSGDLRIVSRAGLVQQVAPARTSRGYVHPRRPNEETPMNPPADRRLAAADARRVAAARAARAAATSRRAAAARRRLVLTLVVAVAAVAAWAVVGLATLPVLAAVVPTAALLLVVLLGRRASTAGAAADARFRADIEAASSPARRSGPRETAPPRLRMDVDPAALLPPTPPVGVGVTVAGATPGSASDAVEPGWTPVPVPPPAYTLKRSAPRRQVEPYLAEAPGQPGAAAPAERTATSSPSAPSVAHDAAPATPPAINVQAVLAKRRAAG